jgi:arylsulfatase A-like enzyme
MLRRTRRCLAGLLVLTWVLLVAAATARAQVPPARPNVLFIAVDDLNDWIGCLGGNPQCRTPNIDRLAARGVLFTQAHCAAPACNPSRVALLTGIRPSTSGVYLNSHPWRPAMPDAVTLPQLFMQHDYHVVGGGKIFHGSFPDPASWHEYYSQRGDPKPGDDVARDPHSRAGGIVWGVLDVEDEDMNDYRVVSHAIDYLQKPHERPFFLACGLFRPHMPWQVPRRYYERYPREQIQLPKVLDDDLQDVPPAGVRMARPEGDHANILRTDNWDYAVQGYLASIAFADEQVGRLIDALDASPHRDNTIIVLWGDHGWHLGEKHHWRKFSLWEEATRAPLLMVAPGVTRPESRCERAVDFLSIYPTLAELCGLPRGDHLEGASLVPLLKDPRQAWDRPAVTTHGRNNHAVRSNRYRYIRYADGSEELYDHRQDPGEWRNLAADPDQAATKRELAAWLPKENAAEVKPRPAARRQQGAEREQPRTSPSADH